jgi:monofunctional biosynthetic peptidoglycan transglycosylase
MAQTNRGRRAAAEKLGISGSGGANGRSGRAGNDAREYVDLIDERPSRGRKTQPKPRRASKRGKLPSDGTILAALLKGILRWVVRIGAAFLLVSIALVILYRFVDPPVTPLMLIRPLEAMGEGRMTGIDKKWTPIDRIAPVLLRSAIASEDSRFFVHNGVDWQAVEAAEKHNQKPNVKQIHGASTITMQCARNVFLWQGRNYIRKGLEIYFTYLMEAFWSKRRILEVYMNVIEWGDGIYGAEAAAQHYFGTSASHLTPRQAALLVAVLPNPRRFDAGAPDAHVNSRAATIQARAPLVDLEEAGAPARKGE